MGTRPLQYGELGGRPLKQEDIGVGTVNQALKQLLHEEHNGRRVFMSVSVSGSGVVVSVIGSLTGTVVCTVASSETGHVCGLFCSLLCRLLSSFLCVAL